MTKYRRLWPCGVCGKPVYYDDEAHTVSCGCSTVHDIKMRKGDRDMIDLAEETVKMIIQELKRHAEKHQCGFCAEILREEFGIEC